MTWIETIEPERAEGELAKLYDAIGGARGGVAEVHRAQSLHPRAMRAHMELYKAVVFSRASLGRIERERIAVVVSAANRCRYCIRHHGESLGQLGESTEVREALERGTLPDSIPASERTLLEWAQQATTEPGDASEQDVTALREAGYDDRAILDAVLTVGYFNFVNRLVLLLGVHIEQGFEELCGELG
jgi:uncharacterized peroxidase-related enzyme